MNMNEWQSGKPPGICVRGARSNYRVADLGVFPLGVKSGLEASAKQGARFNQAASRRCKFSLVLYGEEWPRDLKLRMNALHTTQGKVQTVDAATAEGGKGL